jgi:plasmid stability protein
MATLHIRSVPEDLYRRLRELARDSHRSLSAQVVSLLTEAISARDATSGQSQLLAAIRRRRFHPPPGAPDSRELLREDRQR